MHKWEHYFPVYERYFSRWRNKTCLFIEIGVSKGGSLQVWKEFFGPFATIVGVDIDPKCAAIGIEGVNIRIGDQSDLNFLSKIVDEFGAPDIVIDDGSHQMAHLGVTFEFLYPKLSKNGIYLVEDLHTCYWEEYGGGVGKEKNFLNQAKHLVDALNAVHSRGAISETFFSKNTLGIHFYDSIAVFERGSVTRKNAPITGKAEQEQFGSLKKLFK